VTTLIPERIAEVVADIRAGRTHHPAATDEAGIVTSLKLLDRAQQPQPVVDCTAIFNQCHARDTIALYEDHPQIVPPWPNALLCYVNTFGNVICLQVHRRDHDGSRPKDWFTENDVDWARVKWIAETAVWVGGQSGDGQHMPTSGPCHLFRHAINADGSPADINWLALTARKGQLAERRNIDDANQGTWDAAMITVGAALNFLNASNTDIAEPARPRPQRRRLARTGVTVQTIVVRPPGKRRAKSAAARPIDASETVLSSVRGHFSHYGEAYGRGLLFGKYAGKFWISSHIRGAGEDTDPKDYILRPAKVDA
jgi:hypothetical protein